MQRDYSASNAKHYCEYCNTWVPNTPHQRKAHDATPRHKQCMQNKIVAQRKQKAQVEKQEQMEKMEMARIEAEASQKMVNNGHLKNNYLNHAALPVPSVGKQATYQQQYVVATTPKVPPVVQAKPNAEELAKKYYDDYYKQYYNQYIAQYSQQQAAAYAAYYAQYAQQQHQEQAVVEEEVKQADPQQQEEEEQEQQEESTAQESTPKTISKQQEEQTANEDDIIYEPPKAPPKSAMDKYDDQYYNDPEFFFTEESEQLAEEVEKEKEIVKLRQEKAAEAEKIATKQDKLYQKQEDKKRYYAQFAESQNATSSYGGWQTVESKPATAAPIDVYSLPAAFRPKFDPNAPTTTTTTSTDNATGWNYNAVAAQDDDESRIVLKSYDYTDSRQFKASGAKAYHANTNAQNQDNTSAVQEPPTKKIKLEHVKEESATMPEQQPIVFAGFSLAQQAQPPQHEQKQSSSLKNVFD